MLRAQINWRERLPKASLGQTLEASARNVDFYAYEIVAVVFVSVE
jgi:hypothetical protein